MRNAGLLIIFAALLMLALYLVTGLTGFGIIGDEHAESRPSLADYAGCMQSYIGRGYRGADLLKRIKAKQDDPLQGLSAAESKQLQVQLSRAVGACKGRLPPARALSVSQLYQADGIKKDDLIYFTCTVSQVIYDPGPGRGASFLCSDKSRERRVRVFPGPWTDMSRIRVSDNIATYARVYAVLERTESGSEKWTVALYLDDLSTSYSNYDQ